MPKGKPKGREIIWMEVTKDKYELPVMVADSARELAEVHGVTRGSIESSECQYRKGKLKTCPWRKVEIKEDL